MIGGFRISSIAVRAALAALMTTLCFASPAGAAEPVFPRGSRIGLLPPAGMVLSKRFPGFEDVAKDANIIIATLPAAAYPEMEQTPAPDALKAQGITVEKREPIQLNVGKGFLLTGNQTADKQHFRKWLLVTPADNVTALVSVQVPENDPKYTDAVVRAALATLAVRGEIPDPEKLSLLPFAIGDLAGFRVGDIIPGRAVMLIDAPAFPRLTATTGLPEPNLDARFMIAIIPGGPTDLQDEANFARFAFNTISGIRDIRITMSEPIRMNNQQGYETVAQAKDSSTGADVMVVQWLRFSSGGFLQMTGIARAALWSEELSRLRAVRDSIQPKSN